MPKKTNALNLTPTVLTDRAGARALITLDEPCLPCGGTGQEPARIRPEDGPAICGKCHGARRIVTPSGQALLDFLARNAWQVLPNEVKDAAHRAASASRGDRL